MRGFCRIPVSGLKEGSHLYDFKIGSRFFASFDKSLIREADLLAVATLVKRSAHMELNIKLSGSVKLKCDRCLELYDQQVVADDNMLVKFGDMSEEDDEVMVISPGENELILDQLIYEYSHLALPLKKMHPDDSNGNSTCDPEMLERLARHSKREEETDPRWKELEKLKNSNN
ncbi:MAG: DUF177 domain-containing protein [Bacteroidales bacterium]|nr:DUF177 domain-containing protein [Bacteroidales bacterium]